MSGIEEKAFRFAGADGHVVAAWRWSKPVAPRAVLQIAHGMGEYALRYRDKLETLTDAGIVIYANDHRGHGATSTPDKYGDFGAGGFPALVSDMALLTAMARKENPGLPLILLGHSMGSFAAQLYVMDHSAAIGALVISGSAAMDEIVKVLPTDPDAPALNAFNAAFEPARTEFDWLSRDEAEVDAYIASPMCGFSVTPEGMGSMVVSLLPTAEAGALNKIRADLPVYFFSGDKDPVGGPDLAFLKVLVDRYIARGLKVTTDFYKGGRHEMINETNRVEVVANLRQFIESVIA